MTKMADKLLVGILGPLMAASDDYVSDSGIAR
jgi:hypothetical protein